MVNSPLTRITACVAVIVWVGCQRQPSLHTRSWFACGGKDAGDHSREQVDSPTRELEETSEFEALNSAKGFLDLRGINSELCELYIVAKESWYSVTYFPKERIPGIFGMIRIVDGEVVWAYLHNGVRCASEKGLSLFGEPKHSEYYSDTHVVEVLLNEPV